MPASPEAGRSAEDLLAAAQSAPSLPEDVAWRCSGCQRKVDVCPCLFCGSNAVAVVFDDGRQIGLYELYPELEDFRIGLD